MEHFTLINQWINLLKTLGLPRYNLVVDSYLANLLVVGPYMADL
jgi:hypothetical protein